MPFLLLLALAGFIEFWFMLVVAGHIGAFATVLLTIATAVIGFGLMQRQGLATLARAREKMEQGQSPAREMIEGVALFVGGCLLLLPGFITDALGLLLMLPGIRGVLAKRFIGPVSRVRMGGFRFRQGPDGASGHTFEGQYERTDQATSKQRRYEKKSKFFALGVLKSLLRAPSPQTLNLRAVEFQPGAHPWRA